MHDSTYYIQQSRLIQKLNEEGEIEEANKINFELQEWLEKFDENNPMTFPEDASERTYDGKKVVGVFLE